MPYASQPVTHSCLSVRGAGWTYTVHAFTLAHAVVVSGGPVQPQALRSAGQAVLPGQGDDRHHGWPRRVSQNGQLLTRRGRSLPANASGCATHRDSITSRFGCSLAAPQCFTLSTQVCAPLPPTPPPCVLDGHMAWQQDSAPDDAVRPRR
jgi:hypothetical protein|eukprot:COSAG01_NODE_6993_length_3399_cov_11.666162_2_plen_150_part_00